MLLAVEPGSKLALSIWRSRLNLPNLRLTDKLFCM